jgi:serine/threonine protein kinase
MKPIPFGKYTLLERISHGGMAEVFRAKGFGAAGFERIVAIKVLLPAMASDEEFITMLIDEAKIAGQLSHTNIAQIFDLGQIEGRYYIVQEYVNGRDLRSLMAQLEELSRGFSVPQACHIVLKICEGLDYAHDRCDEHGQPLNVVHRDISPQNVIVSYDGEIKLIDFGIAKAEGRATRTMAGLVKGKFAYMSPEQLRGLPVDRRSDVFALGILFHELLSGQPLFKRDSDFETLKRARTADIEPPSDHNPAVPPELDRIILRARTRHVDDRYQTAGALRDDLWDFIRSTNHDCTRSELGAWMRSIFEDASGARRPPSASLRPASEPVAAARGKSKADEAPATVRHRAPESASPDLDEDESGTMVDPELVDRFQAQSQQPSEDEIDAATSMDPLGSAAQEAARTRAAPEHLDSGRPAPRSRTNSSSFEDLSTVRPHERSPRDSEPTSMLIADEAWDPPAAPINYPSAAPGRANTSSRLAPPRLPAGGGRPATPSPIATPKRRAESVPSIPPPRLQRSSSQPAVDWRQSSGDTGSRNNHDPLGFYDANNRPMVHGTSQIVSVRPSWRSSPFVLGLALIALMTAIIVVLQLLL